MGDKMRNKVSNIRNSVVLEGSANRERTSEELSNTATSESDEKSDQSSACSPTRASGLLAGKVHKRARKSAEMAMKRIRRESNVISAAGKADQMIGGEDGSSEISCDKSDCRADGKCALNISASCAARATRFFHISRGEHVCQQCYDEFRMGKPMFDRYVGWKKRWIASSRCTPRLRMFIFEQLLPFWLNCSECGKFRRIFREPISGESSELSALIIAMFKCAYAFPIDFDKNPCSVPEESDVVEVRSASSAYIISLSVPPLLHQSPAIHFLRDHYYHDEVGISPMNAQFEVKKCRTSHFLCPFNIPDEPSKAFSLRPDVLEYDEVCAFPEFTACQLLYLALRNLVVALWSLNPFEYLSYETCISHLICPGLARVWYSIELKRVFDYLTMKGVINTGLLPMPRQETLLIRKRARRLDVVIVGGGISGLGAARQLRSLGAKVTLLEAKSKLGGRMQDDWSLGVAVGCGAQLITGTVNNPIVLMCEQIGLGYRLLLDECPLIEAHTGKLVNRRADRVVDEHFNCLLDVVGQLKKRKEGENAQGESLLAQLNGIHEELLKHIDFRWAKEFERLLQWQIGNLEFSCGAKLDKVSAKHWDQNESVGQFAGAHALLSEGSGELVKRMAEGTDIRCGHQVMEIDWKDRSARIRIKCSNGKQFSCDKILLCIPLTQYQREQITFTPELPDRKKIAYNSLGSGLIEKVAVRFPRRFWSNLLKNEGSIDYFGNVPASESDRGLFNIFYDFSTRPTSKRQPQHFVLMSYLCGDYIQRVAHQTDVEIVEQFVETLRTLFPSENVPTPNGFVVTHWGRDPLVGMAYSFIKVGASGQDYDELANSVDGRLYFAGECTNRFFPQTMTGAYVSALRESGKMVEHWIA